jgi:hypothetical protein
MGARLVAVALLALAWSCAGGGDDTGSGRGSPGAGGTTAEGAGGGGGATAGADPTQTGPGTTEPTDPEERPIGGVDPGEECNGITERTENVPRPVDIIWAIDNSGSMIEEAQAVQLQMNTFANQIVTAGIDVHVIVISQEGPPGMFYPPPVGIVSGVCIPPPLGSGMCPDDNKPPEYLHVFVEVGSTNKFFTILETYPQYQAALRRDALKYFAVVTDDTDSDSQHFANAVANLDPGPPNMFQDWKFFGIFCTGASGCPTSGGSQVLGIPCVETGTPYLELVDQTGGLAGDLCAANADSAGVFAELAKTVIQHKQIACEWAIPAPPMGQAFDKTRINVNYTPSTGPVEPLFFAENGACGDKDGWYYDNPDAPTRVVACPKTCARVSTDMGGQIDLIFGCMTIPIVL